MAKITHIFKTYFPQTAGGLEEAIRQCGTFAVAHDFEVEVVTVGPADYVHQTNDGITVRFYKKTIDYLSNPFSLSFARSFKSICHNTDLLHFHFPWPTAELLAISGPIRPPAIVTFHCDIHRAKLLKTFYQPLIRRYLSKMDKICVTSHSLAQGTPCLSPFKDKIQEIPLFLNTDRFSQLPGPDQKIRDLAARLDKYALFAGVLRWYKGLDVLLDASKFIARNIVIVGKGDLLAHLKSRIESEHLDNVHLIGFQSDANLKHLLEKSRMVVLPSITGAEAFGQILLEGLYFSKPLVSTQLGTGTSVVNQNNHTGFVVRPGSATALARAMNLIFTNDDLFKRFSSNAFSHYLERFTAPAQGKKYIRIYNSLLSR